jgi:hypothetical protein
MKKSELKTIIKECVKEILFEEGILSELVAEVAVGITKAQSQLLESRTTTTQAPQVPTQIKEEQEEARRKRLLETKRKMLDAIGGEKMQGVFEGTEPLRNTGNSSAHSPLSGKDPNDAGVDISGLFGLAGQRWQQLK